MRNRQPTPKLLPDVFLDVYFSRLHGKPYYILDEDSTRQRSNNNQLPACLAYAINAVSARYAICPIDSFQALTSKAMPSILVDTMQP